MGIHTRIRHVFNLCIILKVGGGGGKTYTNFYKQTRSAKQQNLTSVNIKFILHVANRTETRNRGEKTCYYKSYVLLAFCSFLLLELPVGFWRVL